eukprot:TRINITY_DN24352_c0_g4_i1.p1 TRINITY_DN24352_c0_g4~~TRINITY_DN24352_c0_g4_i1.p1  ORF type:complete len:881 (-),score=203.06 TRINITY_DN24352_c0_g4_i1:68-2710(-)
MKSATSSSASFKSHSSGLSGPPPKVWEMLPLRETPTAMVNESECQARQRRYRRAVERRTLAQRVGCAYAVVPRLPPPPSRTAPSAGFAAGALRGRASARGGEAPFAEDADAEEGETWEGASPTSAESPDAVGLGEMSNDDAPAPLPPGRPFGRARTHSVMRGRKSSAHEFSLPPLRASQDVSDHMPHFPASAMRSSIARPPRRVTYATTLDKDRESERERERFALAKEAGKAWVNAVWAKFGHGDAAEFAEDDSVAAPRCFESTARGCAKWLALRCKTRKGAFQTLDDFEASCLALGLDDAQAASVASRLWTILGKETSLPVPVLFKLLTLYEPSEADDEARRSPLPLTEASAVADAAEASSPPRSAQSSTAVPRSDDDEGDADDAATTSSTLATDAFGSSSCSSPGRRHIYADGMERLHAIAPGSSSVPLPAIAGVHASPERPRENTADDNGSSAAPDRPDGVRDDGASIEEASASPGEAGDSKPAQDASGAVELPVPEKSAAAAAPNASLASPQADGANRRGSALYIAHVMRRSSFVAGEREERHRAGASSSRSAASNADAPASAGACEDVLGNSAASSAVAVPATDADAVASGVPAASEVTGASCAAAAASGSDSAVPGDEAASATCGDGPGEGAEEGEGPRDVVATYVGRISRRSSESAKHRLIVQVVQTEVMAIGLRAVMRLVAGELDEKLPRDPSLPEPGSRKKSTMRSSSTKHLGRTSTQSRGAIARSQSALPSSLSSPQASKLRGSEPTGPTWSSEKELSSPRQQLLPVVDLAAPMSRVVSQDAEDAEEAEEAAPASAAEPAAVPSPALAPMPPAEPPPANTNRRYFNFAKATVKLRAALGFRSAAAAAGPALPSTAPAAVDGAAGVGALDE